MSLDADTIQEILQSKLDIQKLRKEYYIKRTSSLKCPECDLKFPFSSVLAKHVLEKHPGFFQELERVLCVWDYEDAELTNPVDFLETTIRVFSCCGETFTDEVDFNQHKAALHPDVVKKKPKKTASSKEFQCFICANLFVSEKSLKRHIAEVHHKLGRRQCEHCDKTFSDSSGYKRHMAKHEENGMIECSVCNKLVNRYNMATHKRSHDSKRFRCYICGNTFVVERSLRRHIAEVHEKLGQRDCEYCGKHFSDSTGYKRHLAKHEENGMESCQVCFKLINRHIMGSHMKTHVLKEFFCHFCNGSFHNKRLLRLHILSNHIEPGPYANKKPPVRRDPSEVAIVKDIFTHAFCERCGKTFISNSSLLKHIRDVHDRVGAAPCAVCGKVLANRVSYNKHMASHLDDKKIPCPDCGKPVVKHLLAQHRLIHGEKNYHCKLCDKSFHQAPGLKSHMATHDKRSCDICGKVITRLSTFERHMAKHNGAKIPCKVCNEEFEANDLKIHKRTHRIQKNPVVKKESSKKGPMNPKVYFCDLCGKGFAHIRSRVKHLRSLHGQGRDGGREPRIRKKKTDVKIEPQDLSYNSQSTSPIPPPPLLPLVLHKDPPYFF